jgi:molecular chaperone HscA
MTDGMARGGWLLGVDLGTSHTVAMLRRPDGRTRPLLFDGQPLLPSAVYLDTTGRLHVGRDAVRLGQAEPGRLEPNPKRHVDAESVLLGDTEVPTADLLAALLGAVAREAVAATGFLPPAVLTYPAAWGSRRREILTTALARAGWPPATQLLPEPVAAAHYFADVLRRPVPVGSALAVFDFGGGTLDIAVVRNEGVTPEGLPRFAVAASGGIDDLGGLDLDAALVEHLGAELSVSEPSAWAALTEPVTLAQWRARRQFWEDVRGAKEMLSRTALAPVPVPGVEHAAHLTRDEFEAAAGPLLRRGVAEAGSVIRAAGLAPTELAGLFLVGGSSRVPLVARLLHGELGIAPTVLEQPELPVAEGAIIAVAAADNAVAPAEPAGEATPDDTAVGAGPDSAATPAAPMRPAAVPPISDTMTHPAPAAEGDGPGLLSTEAMQPTSAAAAVSTETDVAAASPPAQGAAPAQHAKAPAAAGQAPKPSATPPHQPLAGPSQHAKPGAVVAAGGSQGAEPHYAEPVDPWATGEAAAFGNQGGGPLLHPVSGAPVSGAAMPPGAESWLASTHPDPDEAGGPGARAKLPAYKRKAVWIVAAVTAVVLGAAATVVVLLWPGYPALDYEPLADLHRVKPVVPVSSAFSAAALRDGRAYFASADDTNTLGVVAAATDTGETAWTSKAAGSANRWEFFFAIPGAVVAITGIDSLTGQRRVVLLDAGDGKKRWERAMDGYDNVLFAGDRVVLIDRREGRLLGLDPRTGKGLWEKRNPRSEYGQTTTQVVPVTTEDDFAGPAGTDGVAFAEPFDDDKRIVQIGADDSAQVRDADSGEVVAGPRQSVAQTDDKVIAHNGRLIVAESTDAHRLFAYDLKKLEPKLLYTPPSTNSRLEHLTPCGADRICLIETTGSDAKTAQVVAVNAADGGVVWRRPVVDAEDLIAVGEAVLVPQNTSPAQVSLVASDGQVAWTRAGVAGRLDAGNTLQFSKALSTSADDPALAGEHVGDKAVPLGSLADVRSSTCAWDTSHLACVADADFIVQRFAG